MRLKTSDAVSTLPYQNAAAVVCKPAEPSCEHVLFVLLGFPPVILLLLSGSLDDRRLHNCFYLTLELEDSGVYL